MTSHTPVARHAVPSLAHVTMANAAPFHAVNFNIAGETTPISDGKEYGVSQMMATNGDMSLADTTDGILAMARQNASSGNDITTATMMIMAKRLALGLAAALDPLQADHVEFARVVPEKVQAFSAVGMVMLSQSGEASRQLVQFASEEIVTTACATIGMTGCFGPAAWAEAQSQFARAWLNRLTSNFNTLGMLLLTTQAAAMAPIRQTVVANAERLGG
jgi:hypothetical protein